MVFPYAPAYEYNVLQSLAWVYQNRLYYSLFTSYLKHYLIPSLPVRKSLYTRSSQVEDRAKRKRRKKTSHFLLGPSNRGRALPAGYDSDATVQGLLGIRRKAQKIPDAWFLHRRLWKSVLARTVPTPIRVILLTVALTSFNIFFDVSIQLLFNLKTEANFAFYDNFAQRYLAKRHGQVTSKKQNLVIKVSALGILRGKWSSLLSRN